LGVAKAVKGLPSKNKTLSQTPVLTKKKVGKVIQVGSGKDNSK
jgi:hypothetical protein